MQTLVTILGTRPEILKLWPLVDGLDRVTHHVLVHSGQHYSYDMDARFFDELGFRRPDIALDIGSASHGDQLSRLLSRVEPVLLARRPAAVLVQGDTNTTLGGALCAAKLGIPVVHLEAGGRSFDRRMPEEVNRVVVDHVATTWLAADEQAVANLDAEGIRGPSVHLVGSTAIDAVDRARTRLGASDIVGRLGLAPGRYLVVTAHRAGNTATDVLPGLLEALASLADTWPLVWPVHPRTAAAIEAQGLTMPARIRTLPPLGYLDTLALVADAAALLTDSGGLQEEAAVLGTPTLILRDETEWTYLLGYGGHQLIGATPASVAAGAARWLEPSALRAMRARPAPVRRGAADRAVEVIAALMR